MGRRYPAWRQAKPASPYTKPKIRLRKGFCVARRRRRPALGITRKGPLWIMGERPYMIMDKGLSCVPIVENPGDSFGETGTVKPLKGNAKVVINVARDRTPDSITGDGPALRQTHRLGGARSWRRPRWLIFSTFGTGASAPTAAPMYGRARGWSAGMRVKADSAPSVAIAHTTPSNSPREPTGAPRNRPSTPSAETRRAPQGETTRSF